MAELLASFTYIPEQRWGPVSPHGIGTALGFFLGAWLMAKRAEPRGIPRPEVYNAVTWGAIGAIIGARGFYVLAHLSSYQSVTDALKVWEGGLTMFGGFIGGLVLGLSYLRRRKFSIRSALDAAAPGFVVGVLIGRLGDIAIADHLGERTNFVFGYKIPNAPLAPGYGPPYYVPGAVVHHTAVYDFIGALVLLGFLYWLERRKPTTGTLFAAFSIWYGLQRFLIDFTRNRTIIESSYFGLSGSQWAGLGFAALGVYLLMRVRRQGAEPAAEPVAAAFAPLSPPGEAVGATSGAPEPPATPTSWTPEPPSPVPPPTQTSWTPEPPPQQTPPAPAPSTPQSPPPSPPATSEPPPPTDTFPGVPQTPAPAPEPAPEADRPASDDDDASDASPESPPAAPPPSGG
jgi:phosphatidylglycerol:prolipoprotein diacylglycerol transferase